jgi:hypothetical protein
MERSSSTESDENRASTHGVSFELTSGTGSSSPWSSQRRISWVHVVPDLYEVVTMMSSGRGS